MQEIDKRTNWLAIWSLILSILSLVCCCVWWLSLMVAVAGIILGILGFRSDNPNQEDAAIAGIIVGSVGAIIAIAVVVMQIFIYANVSNPTTAGLF